MTQAPESTTADRQGGTKLRKIAVALFVAFAASTAGIAYAAWNATGAGTANAKATTAQVLATLDATANTTATLYPGATGTANVTISNPNPYPVRVTGIAGAGTITSDKGAACNAATGVSFTDQAGTFDVPAQSSASFALSGAVRMSNASDNACQGAVFTIPVALTGASNAA